MAKKSSHHSQLLFITLALFCTVILANLCILFVLTNQAQTTTTKNTETTLLSELNSSSSYTVSDEITRELDDNKQFAMIINPEGTVAWSYNMPSPLGKEYSLSDVARFSRYYLDDYPVHIYALKNSHLLVVGSAMNSIWKYQLEYNIFAMKHLITFLPVLLTADIIIMIAVPLWIQRRWMKSREHERTEWIAGVSHDIRTPLTLILGQADALARHYDNNPEVQHKAQIIEQQSLRLRDLISNLNLSNKLTYGHCEISKEKINLPRLLRHIVSEVMNRVDTEKFKIDLSIAPHVYQATIMADAQLTQRMIENLINNSLHHNPDGCIIRITVKPSTHGSEHYILSIEDNGVGVSDQQLIDFNSHSIQQTTSSAEHGLGISIVRHISRLHSWHIHFQNIEPHGMRCTVNI